MSWVMDAYSCAASVNYYWSPRAAAPTAANGCCPTRTTRALPHCSARSPPYLPLRALCSKQLEGEAEVSKLEALQWVHVLLSRDARLLSQQRQALLLALCEALGAASGVRCAATAVFLAAGRGAGLGGAAAWVAAIPHLTRTPDPPSHRSCGD